MQEKLVAFDRRLAATALTLPPAAPLNPDQRNRIRTLGVSVFALGHILSEQGDPVCVATYEESLSVDQSLGDTAGEATTQFNLGHAYKDLPAIRNLDAAEAAYQRSLELRLPDDALKRSVSIKQIGMVHHERYREARQRGEIAATQLKHAQAAEQHYQQALALCPATALADLGPIHHQLGKLYAETGQTESASEQFEKAAPYFEQTGNHHHAGVVRHGMAVTYLQAAERADVPARQRDLLLRARAYAQAALRDFQHYQGRAAAEEAKAQRLIDHIERALG